MTREITFAKAINEALDTALSLDNRVLLYGLGIPDPKGVFGTTEGLQMKHGENRVFDMPTAENGMTGVAIGAALGGAIPVMTHQRLDFFLLAMDQLVNNAAKWHYMFGGNRSVPITIRLIIGRGWGQGPTHSQNLQSWFSHIPGLKVVVPTTANDAKGLLLESIFDPNPVIFLEHRWLHNMLGNVQIKDDFRLPIGKCEIISEGNDITIVSASYMTIEALRAESFLKNNQIDPEIIDMKTIQPIDWRTIQKSLKKTGRLIVLDTSNETGSVATDIVSRMSTRMFEYLKCAPRIIALPDAPSPTSRELTKYYYRGSRDIVNEVFDMFNVKDVKIPFPEHQQDVPGDWFKGPF